jgi:coenzyme Q-binding protein COQ10
MKVHEESHRLPYTAVQMFDFVVNVERYPEFLPGYLWAGIRGRSGDTLYVDQAVGFRGSNCSISPGKVLDLEVDWG